MEVDEGGYRTPTPTLMAGLPPPLSVMSPPGGRWAPRATMATQTELDGPMLDRVLQEAASSSALDAEDGVEGRRVSGELVWILQRGMPQTPPKSPPVGRSIATVPVTPPRASPPGGYRPSYLDCATLACTPWAACAACAGARVQHQQSLASGVSQRRRSPQSSNESDSDRDSGGLAGGYVDGLSRGAFHGSLPQVSTMMNVVPRDVAKRAKVSAYTDVGGFQGSLVFAPLGTSPRPVPVVPAGVGTMPVTGSTDTLPQSNALYGFAPASPVASSMDDVQKLLLLSPMRNGTADFRADLPPDSRGFAQRPKPVKPAPRVVHDQCPGMPSEEQLVSHLTADLRMTERELRAECGGAHRPSPE